MKYTSFVVVAALLFASAEAVKI